MLSDYSDAVMLALGCALIGSLSGLDLSLSAFGYQYNSTALAKVILQRRGQESAQSM